MTMGILSTEVNKKDFSLFAAVHTVLGVSLCYLYADRRDQGFFFYFEIL